MLLKIAPQDFKYSKNDVENDLYYTLFTMMCDLLGSNYGIFRDEDYQSDYLLPNKLFLELKDKSYPLIQKALGCSLNRATKVFDYFMIELGVDVADAEEETPTYEIKGVDYDF